MQNDNSKFKVQFSQRLVSFSLGVIKLCGHLRKDRNLWSISDQLIRSATSIGANIMEARSCNSKKDYLRFFQIALRSANETKYWLILIRESNKEYRIQVQHLFQEAEELSNIIASGVLTMKGKR